MHIVWVFLVNFSFREKRRNISATKHFSAVQSLRQNERLSHLQLPVKYETRHVRSERKISLCRIIRKTLSGCSSPNSSWQVGWKVKHFPRINSFLSAPIKNFLFFYRNSNFSINILHSLNSCQKNWGKAIGWCSSSGKYTQEIDDSL